MANQFLTVSEVVQQFTDELTELHKRDPEAAKRLVYEMQTSLGGFPDTPEERKKAGIE